LDFFKGLSTDDPAPLFGTLKYFIIDQARSPYERQAAAATARAQAARALFARLRGLRLRLFEGLLKWAQRYAPLREDALADLGLGWPVLRHLLREFGERLVAAGAIKKADDVFWLQLTEAETAARAIGAQQPILNFYRTVAERRATCERERRVTPPVLLPQKQSMRFMGIDFTAWSRVHRADIERYNQRPARESRLRDGPGARDS